MNRIKFDYSQVCNFVKKEEINTLFPQAAEALKSLKNGTSKGNDFLGWLDLPAAITEAELNDIEKTAAELRSRTQVLVVIGIGGSYLGARAVIEALAGSFDNFGQSAMKVIFAGHNIGEDYYHELMAYLADKEFGICVISKSGTTTAYSRATDCSFSRQSLRISTAPFTSALMSNPATAMGSNPTGVSTEKRPPTLSGIIKVLYPSWSARVRKAPLLASVMATMRFPASAFPTLLSSISFSKRKAMAGSVVVPDLEITQIPNSLSAR